MTMVRAPGARTFHNTQIRFSIMTNMPTRRAILGAALDFLGAAALTGALVGPLTHGGSAWAQDHSGGTGGRGGGAGGSGEHSTGGSDDTEHSHDDDEHADTDHEHTEHDPDSGTDHADGKKGPKYRGGRAATGTIGRGRGQSLEDRVFKGH